MLVTLGMSLPRPAASPEALKCLSWTLSQQDRVQWLCQHQSFWSLEESQYARNPAHFSCLCSCKRNVELTWTMSPWRAIPPASLQQEAVKALLPISAWPHGCSWTQTSLVMKAFPMSVCFLSISLMTGKCCCSRAWSTSKMPGVGTGAL